MPSIYLFLVVFLIMQSGRVTSQPTKSQPTILYVPGAWHQPIIFDKVIAILSTKGFGSRKISLASVGRSPPVTSLEPDVEVIRNTALVETRQGRDVIVVCHSYGGVPTNQALRGLDKPQSPGGGRVLAIVYIASYMIREGVSGSEAVEAQGGSPNSLEFEFLPDGNVFFKNTSNPAEVFYSDLSAQEGKFWVSKLRPQSGATYAAAANYAAWKVIPSWYLVTAQDKTLRPEVQRGWIKEARQYLDQLGGSGTGARRIKSQEINAGHSPFLSRPLRIAEFIKEASDACNK
jgi:pimeloyl-ACP methyl ester carboxylesterase